MADARDESVRSEGARGGDCSVDGIASQFEEQWKQAVQGTLLPTLGMHLERVEASHRGQLREALAAIDERYRTQFAAAGHASDVRDKEHPTTVQGEEVAETVVHRAPQEVHSAASAASPNADPQAAIEPGLGEAETNEFVPTDRQRSQPPSTPQSTRRPSLPGYEIINELGRGGMGVVYQARQTALDRVVALKMILPGADTDEANRERFHAEAEAVAQLQHPHIVQIHDVGEHDGRPYFCLEFVDGHSLTEEMGGKPLTSQRAAQLVETIARAMQFAHDHGIVHRDLKPANILLTQEGVPKVSDFGLVKRLEGDSSQTHTGTVLGTPSFMAPEQGLGEKNVGPLADVYALGAMLYCLLTGRPPFLGATHYETVAQLLEQEPVAPSRLQPRTPSDLETICLKCLQKDPAKRYARADELADDLGRFRDGLPITARRVGALERAWLWCKRNPRIAIPTAAAALLALALMIGGPIATAVIYQQKEQADTNAQLALDQRELALDTMGALVYEVQKELEKKPDMQSLKQELLVVASENLEKLSQMNKDYRGADIARASATRRIGDVLLQLGDSQQALQEYQTSLQIATQLHADGQLTRPHLNFATIYDGLGNIAQRLGKLAEAKQHFLKVLFHYQQMQKEEPDKFFGVLQEIAGVYGRLGNVTSALGEAAESRQYYAQSMEIRKQWVDHEPDNLDARRELAGAFGAMGTRAFSADDLPEAKRYVRESIDMLEQLAQRQPNDYRLPWNVALKYSQLGNFTIMDDQPAEAKDCYQQAISRLEPLLDSDPKNARMKGNLGRAYYGIGTACLQLSKPESGNYYRQALDIFQKRLEDDPANRAKMQEVMLALARCGEHAPAAKLADQLRQDSSDQRVLYAVAGGYALCAAAADTDPKNQPLGPQYRDRAIAALQAAVERGYADAVSLRRDPDLAPIRGRSEFEELIARSEQHETSSD